MSELSSVRVCPFCKEDIRSDAVRCKHCRSDIAPERPAHGGTCPYCREQVATEAIKCKHCGSAIGTDAPVSGHSGCGCGCGGPRDAGQSHARLDESALFSRNTEFEGREESAVPSFSVSKAGCGPCEPTGGVGWTPNGIVLRGNRTCCRMIPFWQNGRIIWRRICWAEACGVSPGVFE